MDHLQRGLAVASLFNGELLVLQALADNLPDVRLVIDDQYPDIFLLRRGHQPSPNRELSFGNQTPNGGNGANRTWCLSLALTDGGLTGERKNTAGQFDALV